MAYAISFCIAFIVATIAMRLMRRPRRPEPGVTGTARQIKQMFVAHASDFTTRRGPPPKRPRGLDKRLPYAKAVEMRRLFPYTDETWPAFHDSYYEVIESIREELAAIDPDSDWYELLTPGRQAIILASELEMEVNNGGFDQYFVNSSGDGAMLAPAALRLLGQEPVAQMVERANTQFPGGPPSDRERRLELMDKLGERASKVWGDLDRDFDAHEVKVGGLVAGPGVAYILSHESEFFRPNR